MKHSEFDSESKLSFNKKKKKKKKKNKKKKKKKKMNVDINVVDFVSLLTHIYWLDKHVVTINQIQT